MTSRASKHSSKSGFSVFVDQPESSRASSTRPSSGDGRLPSKASSARVAITVPMASTRKAMLSLNSEDKENDDPSGRAGKKGKTTKSSALSAKPANDKPSTIITRTFDEKVLCSKPAPSTCSLWAGKQPFAAASPERGTCINNKARNAGTIYDLPGTAALPAATAVPLRAPSSKIRSIGGRPVSRPNKAGLSAPVRIFRDPQEQHNEGVFTASPRTDTAATERRMKELTESPLADVTRAYTGTGSFQASPAMGACEHMDPVAAPGSPLPTRSSLLSLDLDLLSMNTQEGAGRDSCLAHVPTAGTSAPVKRRLYDGVRGPSEAKPRGRTTGFRL